MVIARRREGRLARDVAWVIGLLLVSALVLDAVIFWRIVEGREWSWRAESSRILASTIATRLSAAGVGDPIRVEAELSAVVDGLGSGVHVVVVTPGLRPVVELGSRSGSTPEGLGGEEGGLLLAADLREALAGHRVVAATPRAAPWSWRNRSEVASSAPILGPGGTPEGAVRVTLHGGGTARGGGPGGGLGVAALTVLLTGALVAWSAWTLFRTRIVEPVLALAANAEAVAAGRLDLHLPPAPDHELGAVIEAFEQMVRSVEAHQRADAEKLRELRTMNDDLRRARQELVFAEKMATVGRLASGVAHEVGNPLASIIGFTDLLQQDPSLADDLLPRMRQELDRIHRIIRDLLDYARRGSVEGAGDLVPVPVGAVAEAVAALVRVQRRFPALEISVDLGTPAPTVLAEARRLQQVLLNLVVNAAEAMSGRGAVRILRGEAAEGYVAIVVEDEGPGITAQAAEQIWEPFFTTKDTGEGTGLGLSVSLGLVAEMGGTLRYEAAPGGGSRFVVTLKGAE